MAKWRWFSPRGVGETLKLGCVFFHRIKHNRCPWFSFPNLDLQLLIQCSHQQSSH